MKAERQAIRGELLRTLERYHPDLRLPSSVCDEVKAKLGLKSTRLVTSEGLRCVEEGLIQEKKDHGVRYWQITSAGIQCLDEY